MPACHCQLNSQLGMQYCATAEHTPALQQSTSQTMKTAAITQQNSSHAA